MSQPFGDHPTFEDYCVWARSQGCETKDGIEYTDDDGVVSVTVISAPNGLWVVEIGTLKSDFLVPTTIARLDRRLGLESPFFSISDEPD